MSLLDKKTARQYDEASTQINVPDDIASEIARIGKELIQDEHLAGDGRVEVLHVTLKFGVQPDENVLRQAIAQYPSFKVALGKTVVFPEASTEATPVVIEVHGHEFGELHKTIANAMGTQPDDFPYTPHITVAYVEQKEAQHYAGSDAFVGIEFVADAVTLSMFDDDNQVDIPLKTAATPSSVLLQNPNFVQWFGKSKVVDGQGRPKVVYRGDYRADRIGDKFKVNRTTSGRFYFTEDPAIASSYAMNKPDAAAEEAEPSYHDWFKFPQQKWPRERVIPTLQNVWHRLTPEQMARVKHVVETTATDDDGSGKIVFDAGKSLYPNKELPHLAQQYRGNWLLVANYIWLESGQLFDEPREFSKILDRMNLLHDFDDPSEARSVVTPVFLSIQNPVDTSAIPQQTVDALRAFAKRDRSRPKQNPYDQWDKSSQSPREWVGRLEEDLKNGTTHAWTTMPEKITQALQQMGYDGVKDTGGKMGGGEHVVWIAFEPNQIKSATGNKGTFDPAKPSITAASPAQVTPQIPEVAPQVPQGEQPEEEEEVQRDESATDQAEKPKRPKKKQPKLLQPKQKAQPKPKKPPVETTNFNKWFGKSKVRDDDGKPLVVYHGTTHDFQVFDPSKTNVENYYGQGLYFTSSKTDVGENYATDTGGDITSRIENRAGQIMQEWEDRWDDVKDDLGLGDIEEFPSYSEEGYSQVQERAKQEAKREIAGQSQGMTMPVYLSLQNPVIVKKNGGTQFEINFNEETEEESGNGVQLYEAMLRVAGGYYMDVDDLWANVNNNGPEFNAWDFEKVIRDSDRVEDNEGNLANGNFIADVYREMGFDGIIQYAYEAFGPKALGPGYGKTKGMNMEYGTKHYILWDPHKIKSAIGNPGKFDPKNPSITAAVLHDEAKQKTYYHGTDDEAAAQAIISGGNRDTEILKVKQPYYGFNRFSDEACNERVADEFYVSSKEKLERAEAQKQPKPKKQPVASLLSKQAIGEKSVGDLELAKKVMHELMPVLGVQLPEPELKIVNQPRAGRLTQTNDRDFFEGQLIGSYYWSHPKEPEKQKKLEELWEKAQRVLPSGAAKEQDDILKKFREYEAQRKGAGAKLYRGTPEKDEEPKPRDFAAVFFSESPEAAAQYGGHVGEYEWAGGRLLGIDDAETPVFAREFLGRGFEDPQDLEDATVELFMFPWKEWGDFVKSKGYVGTKVGKDVALFDLSGIRKTADVPQLQQLEHGVNKDYDRVRWVYQQFLDSRVQSMSWQDFQKKFPRERNSPLFTEVRQNRPKITTEDMERWMDEFDAKAREYQNYEIEHGVYKDKATSFRDVEQLVLKINQSASAREIIGEDPMMTEFLSQIAQGSAQSGHPAGEATVGWLRVDFIDDDWLLVDEVQSDVINGVELGKRFLTEPTLESLMSKYKSETVKQKIRDMGATEQTFAMSKRNMVQRGYTVEKLDEMKQQLVNLFKDWADYGIASLIEIARRHGIKNVAIHTGESVAKRDPDLEADKAVMYYDQLARSFGFQKQQLDVGDLKGTFWARQASNSKLLNKLKLALSKQE